MSKYLRERDLATKGFRPHSTPKTFKWLEDHYELSEGISIPRSGMYTHYVEFCKTRQMNPVNAASFGKIVRQKFSGLATRRLGTRGQSRYHYYGLGLKWEAQLLAHFAQTGVNYERGHAFRMEMAASSAPTPDLGQIYPSRDILDRLPVYIARDAAEMLFSLYLRYSQKLVDCAIYKPPFKIRDYIKDFWSEFPSVLSPLLGDNSIVSLLGVFDTITYRTICYAIIPSNLLGEVPGVRVQHLIRLTDSLTTWHTNSPTSSTLTLWRLKVHAGRMFHHIVERQATLNRLCLALKLKYELEASRVQMLRDWAYVDILAIVNEASFTMESSTRPKYHQEIILTQCKRFEELLRKHNNLSSIKAWMNEFVHSCVTDYVGPKYVDASLVRFKQSARKFLLLWSAVGTRILRDLTISGAQSFGMYQLLYQILTDYGSQLVESLSIENRINGLVENIGLGESPEPEEAEITGILCDSHCPCRQFPIMGQLPMDPEYEEGNSETANRMEQGTHASYSDEFQPEDVVMNQHQPEIQDFIWSSYRDRETEKAAFELRQASSCVYASKSYFRLKEESMMDGPGGQRNFRLPSQASHHGTRTLAYRLDPSTSITSRMADGPTLESRTNPAGQMTVSDSGQLLSMGYGDSPAYLELAPEDTEVSRREAYESGRLFNTITREAQGHFPADFLTPEPNHL